MTHIPTPCDLRPASAPGDEDVSAGRLMGRLYRELCAIAADSMKGERFGHTLQPTALVHEAYVRLMEADDLHFNDELHFRATAAEMMRRVLIDHARKRAAAKRGGDRARITLTGLPDQGNGKGLDLLEFDEALKSLDQLNPRHRRVVELRFFGGMTHGQVARVLGVSEKTVRVDWSMARAWLRHILGGEFY